MARRVSYIAAVYGYAHPERHPLHVQDSPGARQELLRMGEIMAGNRERLVALYVPKAAGDYARFHGFSIEQLQCIVGLSTLDEMPAGKSVDNYQCLDLRNNNRVRWPSGWPMTPACWMPDGGWPQMRGLLQEAGLGQSFTDFTTQLHYQPVSLAAHPKLSEAILKKSWKPVPDNVATSTSPIFRQR